MILGADRVAAVKEAAAGGADVAGACGIDVAAVESDVAHGLAKAIRVEQA